MEERYFDNIIRQFFFDNYKFINGNSGMNNTTKFLDINNKKYVLRKYESHKDLKKVKYEHEVLKKLNSIDLSFNVPSPVENKFGNTIGIGKDEKLVSIFNHIEGRNPKLKTKEEFYSLGKVVGELTKKLEKMEVELEPVYVPCYELEKSYPKCPLKEVIEFCQNPDEEFKNNKMELEEIGKCFIEFQEIVPKLRKLPHQIIHGDINASNVLENKSGEINAVLDFEFTAKDLRVMDLAICLSEAMSDLSNYDKTIENINSLIKGYKKFVVLTKDEIEVLPYLIILRRLDVIIHFLVRYIEGISNSYMTAEEILKEQIIKARKLCKWVEENKENIKALFN